MVLLRHNLVKCRPDWSRMCCVSDSVMFYVAFRVARQPYCDILVHWTSDIMTSGDSHKGMPLHCGWQTRNHTAIRLGNVTSAAISERPSVPRWWRPCLPSPGKKANIYWAFRALLGVFCRITRATSSFVASVPLPESNNSAPAGRIFMKCYNWVLKISTKAKFD